MAYASAVVVTPTDLSSSGLDVTTLGTTPTATHGNKVLNDGRTTVDINNGDISPITVTVKVNSSTDGLSLPDKTVTIAAGKRYRIGPFKPIYNQADGYVWIICSSVTSVTMAAHRQPK